jgi:hypothetical protein
MKAYALQVGFLWVSQGPFDRIICINIEDKLLSNLAPAEEFKDGKDNLDH